MQEKDLITAMTFWIIIKSDLTAYLTVAKVSVLSR